MRKKVLIVGGVAGGASTAARLRRLDESAQIIMFERGKYISYANCGLPYHIGDVIKSRDSLILQTPEMMKAKYNVDVRIKQEVISINREAKTVTVKVLGTGEEYEEGYDTLVLSPGSSPLKPPIPGINAPRIRTLWTVPDMDNIKSLVDKTEVKSAVIVGGGFIGLEMAENMAHAGAEVTVVEMLDQVMVQLDYEMAQLLHEELRENGVKLMLGDGVSSFEDHGDTVAVNLKSGASLSTELVLLSIGVSPNSELARHANLELNERGGIVVDDTLRTSGKDIYALGDATEVKDFATGEGKMIPLAGPANKQGRIAADNIAGGAETYKGTQGTSILKLFNLTAASTGENEKALIKRGLSKGKDYQSIIITQNSHAGYYPGAVAMTIKLIFAADGQKIFGAQIVGFDGVDKRIDVISTAIRLGAGISDLKNLELAYAPPFSSAKDPINMAGFTAENLLTGKVVFAEWDEVEKNPEAVLLDVTEEAERLVYTLPNSINIPLGKVRENLETLDKSKEIIVFCAIGVRSYNAARILMQNGFEKVKLYPAGTRFYRSTHYLEQNTEETTTPKSSDSERQITGGMPNVAIRVDCSGLQCPGPIMKVFETIKDMQDGQTMEVSASDPGFARDIVAWCRRTGNTLVSNEHRGSDYVALVKKGTGATSGDKAKPLAKSEEADQGKTIIVFSGDLDKVLASFIIANGAAAMGRPVTMFFTFWGLNVLRKSDSQKVEKSFIENAFGVMMPRGMGKLKLSKMNMGGMGTAMMRKIMNDKNVDSLEDMVKKAMKAGVKIIACTMSMDIMGIKEEELIPGVEFGGVGAYLGDAEESNVNLFI